MQKLRERHFWPSSDKENMLPPDNPNNIQSKKINFRKSDKSEFLVSV